MSNTDQSINEGNTMKEYSKRFKVGTLEHGKGYAALWLKVELGKKLRDGKNRLELSICGDIMAGGHMIAGGQCQDDLSQIINRAIPYKKIRQIKEIWSRWHLNGLNAGCEHQRDFGWTYDTHENQGCPICGYKIGTAWKFEALPQYVIETVKSW